MKYLYYNSIGTIMLNILKVLSDYKYHTINEIERKINRTMINKHINRLHKNGYIEYIRTKHNKVKIKLNKFMIRDIDNNIFDLKELFKKGINKELRL